MQQQDLDSEDYKCRELMYIPRSIVKKFVKDFYKELIQKHNRATALVNRL